MSFFTKWWKGTKQHANSSTGMLQTQIIINAFIVVGCLLGAWQIKVSNGYTAVAFVLFAFGLLNLISLVSMMKQYKALKMQEKIFKDMEGKV